MLNSRKEATLLLMLGFTISIVFFLFGINDMQEGFYSSKDDSMEKYLIDIDILYKENSHSKEILENIKVFQGCEIYLNDIGVSVEDKRSTAKILVSDSAYKYPMEEGKLYKNQELIKKNGIIIGKNLKQFTYDKGGEKFITIMNTEYWVAGILGRKNYYSKQDNTIILPIEIMPEDLKKSLLESNFLKVRISSSNVISSEQVQSIINCINKYKDAEYSVKEDKSPNLLSIFMYRNKVTLKFVIKIWAICFISIFIAIYFLIEDRKKEIALRSALGASNNKIYKMILTEMIELYLICFLISIMLYPIFLSRYNVFFPTKLSLNPINMILTFILLMLTIMIITAISTALVLRTKIVTILKE